MTGGLANDERCASTLRLCSKLGTTAHTANDSVLAVTWRRERGEFPHSGTLTKDKHGGCLLWVGQVLSDAGDASLQSIERQLASSEPLADVTDLNGPFVAAAIPAGTRKIVICNDRFGHYPLYHYQVGELNVVATHIELILQWMYEPTIDQDALNLYMRAGELLDGSTMIDGVRFIGGGSRICAGERCVNIDRWWQMRLVPRATISITEAAEGCGTLLRRAVHRMCAANERIGVPLSGGLDSRFLLGLCPDPSRVPSFTMGLSGCRDVRYAEQFAALVRSPHQTFIWEPGFFPPLWSEGVAATAGAFGIGDMFMLPYAARFAAGCDVTLNGLAGDAMLGGNFVKLKWLRADSIEALGRSTWAWRVSESANSRADQLLDGRAGRDLAVATWMSSLASDQSNSPSTRLVEWLFSNRVFRFTNCGTSLLRRHVESHAPFFDNEFVEWMSILPLSYRYKHRLYLKCILGACPAGAAVPWQRSRIKPAWGLIANLTSLAIQRAIGVVDRRVGTSFLSDAKVADPGSWLRSGPWAECARHILLSEACLDRGVFRADAVRSIMESHAFGRDETRTISRLVSIELFARQLKASSAQQRTGPPDVAG